MLKSPLDPNQSCREKHRKNLKNKDEQSALQVSNNLRLLTPEVICHHKFKGECSNLKKAPSSLQPESLDLFESRLWEELWVQSIPVMLGGLLR